MPRIRVEPVNDYIQSLMDEYGVKTVKELSSVTGIPYSTLRDWAAIRGEHRNFASILEAAKKLNKPADEIMRGLLGVAS